MFLLAQINRRRSAPVRAPRYKPIPIRAAATSVKSDSCACGGGCPKYLRNSDIQAKLKIGAPNDKYEQEADRVAEQVMRMPEPKQKDTSQGNTNTDRTKSSLLVGNSEISIQRQEDERGVQIKLRAINLPQRQQKTDFDDGEDFLQAKATPGHTPQVTPNVAASIQNLKGGGQPLPPNQRHYFESRMGQDFSGVRIHTDSKAADTAQTIQAKAFTLGNDVVFNTGQYSPYDEEGKKLLAHELTHVVQQGGGVGLGSKRAPTPFMVGGFTVQRDASDPGPRNRRPKSFGDVGPKMSFRPPPGETAEQDLARRGEAIAEILTLGGEALEIANLFAGIEAAASRHTGTMRVGHFAARERVTNDADRYLPGPPDLRFLLGVLRFAGFLWVPTGAGLLGTALQVPGLVDNLHGLATMPPPRRRLDLATFERLIESLPLLDALDRIDDVAGLFRGSARDFADDLSAAIGRLIKAYPGDPHRGFNVLRTVQDFAPRFRREARGIRSSGNVLLGHVEAAASGFDQAEEYRRVLTFGADGFLRDLRKHQDDRVVFRYARRYIENILEPEFGSSQWSDVMTPQLRSTPNSLERLSHYQYWANSVNRSDGTPQYHVGGSLIPLTESGQESQGEHQKFLEAARREVAESEPDAGSEVRTRPLEELRTPTGEDLVREVTELLRREQPAVLAEYRRLALEGQPRGAKGPGGS